MCNLLYSIYVYYLYLYVSRYIHRVRHMFSMDTHFLVACVNALEPWVSVRVSFKVRFRVRLGARLGGLG